MSRLAATTRDYALAAREIGQRLDVPVIDLWSAFMEKTAWKAAEWKNGEPIAGSLDIDQDPGLVELLFDGTYFPRLRSGNGFTDVCRTPFQSHCLSHFLRTDNGLN